MVFTFHRPSNSNSKESFLLLFSWPLESEGPVCYYHDTYAFQSEYTLCSSLNVKERLSRNRCDIWSLSEYRTDKYSQRKSIIWPVWQNGWVFVYELNDCGFEYRCCHILCLNALATLQNARRASCQPVLMGNCPTCLYVLALSVYWMVSYQSVQVVFRAWDCVAKREVPLGKKVDMKYMQVNVLRNKSSMTKRGDDIPTH